MTRARLLVTSALALVMLPTFGTAAAGAACGPSFSVVPSPNVGTHNNELGADDDDVLHGNAVAAISATNAWAVGHADVDTINGRVPVTLIEHWNGTQWKVVPSPNASSSVADELLAVAAVSASNIWAVGDYVSSGTAHALIEHWNGQSWSVVSSPFVNGIGNKLDAISIIGPKDIWAVGVYTDFNSVNHTLTEHWNGTQWSGVISPNKSVTGLTTNNVLTGVGAVSSTDVLAVGTYYTNGVDSFRTLAERWNGQSWSIVPSANRFTSLGKDNNVLLGVTASATGTPWAVGASTLDIQTGDQAARSTQPLIERWDGTRWSTVASPSRLPDQGTLFGVARRSSSDVWAVGGETTGTGHDVTLVERWNGTKWSVVPSPNLGTLDNDLFGVAIHPTTGTVFAVGSHLTGTSTNPGAYRTLVEQACSV